MSDKSLSQLPAIEIETAPGPRHSVIWLHGLGADGSDFEPIVPELGLPAGAAVRFVFPHAPMQPVTVNGGYVMRAWYDIYERGLDRRDDEQGIRASAAAVAALIRREQQRGVPASAIVLAGFSQGGAVALHAGLRHPERLAGIIALSSYLPLRDTLEAERHAANDATPIFIGHGSFDEVVPLALGERSRQSLEALGYRPAWRVWPMAHSVCLEEVEEVGGFLRGVFELKP